VRFYNVMRLAIALLCLAAALPASAETLRVMSFNVRYAAKSDGPDIWENRRDFMVSTIRKYNPDLIGTQELLYAQGQYLDEAMPEYKWFGVSRRGNREDEHMGVFYRTDRLNLIDSGDYWLSLTPERPGSSAWDMSLPRMVTWGLFELKSNGTKFLFTNTHFAHRREDETARLMSARIIAHRLSLYDASLPLVVTGDFNAPASGPTYETFTALLKDAWTDAAKRSGPEGTFHGFTGKPREARIDWIMYRAPWKTLEAHTLTDNRDGRYPSDHFPIFAVFELP
jgi:endonuclease/exonuclease/phosphatase family metal-dependent hydrolase